MKNNKYPEKWELIRSEKGPDIQLFKCRFNWMKNPRNRKEMKRLVLESPDWINIVAITPEKRVVIVQQYRFGLDDIAMEIPGGVVDPGEKPADAAIRELREETGYLSNRWRLIGVVSPNPAFLNNRCYHWLAEEAQKIEEPSLDEGEDILVRTLSFEEVRQLIRGGKFIHTLALSALSRIPGLWHGLSQEDFYF